MAPTKSIRNTKVRVTRSSLHTAVENEKIKTIKLILSKGGKVNAQDKLDRTALHVAASKGNASIVKLLLQNKAKIVFQDYQGKTPLHLASENGHLEVIKLLLNIPRMIRDSTIINQKNVFETTPLHLAAWKGHSKVVKYLLQRGAQIDSKQISGDSPLHLAAAEGHSKVVKELLSSAANANIFNNCNLTPLHLAVLNQWYLNPKTMSRKLIPKLTKIQTNKYIEVIHILLSNGANINAKDDTKSTPLHYAAAKNHEIFVKILLDYGAEVDGQNNKGRTPLIMAAKDGSPEVIRHLMNSGADIHVTSSIGVGAINYAVFGKNEKVIWMLSCAGADINQTYGYLGQTIMHTFPFLNWHPRPSLIDVIFECGADVNIRESMGSFTPFHIICVKPGYTQNMIFYLYDRFIDDYVITQDGNRHSFLSFLLFGPYRYRNIDSAEFVVKLLVKKEIVDDCPINEVHLAEIEKNFKELHKNCKQELEFIKSIKIINRITLFDILARPIRVLAAYTRNEKFMHALESCNYQKNIIFYLDWFESRIQRATEMKDLFRLGTNALKRLISSKLPYVVCHHVLGFMNLIDLRNLSIT